MREFNNFISFCKKFQNHSFPKLKFKAIDEHYRRLYRTLFDLEEENINKASFLVAMLSFFIIVTFSLILLNLNILIIILYSLIFALIISYRFNLSIYHEIKKIEAELNAMLFLIKIDFSIIVKTLKPNSDYYFSFIKLINEYKIPYLRKFKIILENIHEGKTPEAEISNIITPSKDLNVYLKNLLIDNFSNSYDFNEFKNNSLELSFKIYLKEIQSKISIIFFIGVFFPIGLCFLILFQIINIIMMILIVPIFLYLLNLLCKKFIGRNSYMLGVLNDYSGQEKKKFKEFLLLLKTFAIKLKDNISPERAFQKAYIENRNLFIILDRTIKNQLSHLLNINCSFADLIRHFKVELNSIRYTAVLEAIERFIGENPYYSNEKIFDLLNVLQKHQKLEKKLEIIIKGEKFKIFFFIFLLPILIGAITGMFPFFTLITRNISSINLLIFIDFNNLINIYYLATLLLIFTFSISIISSYFLKIIKFNNKFIVILITNLLFVLTFISSFICTLNLI
ncbi:MAG: hypothetical protein ACFE9Z_06150 [Promethearchaeota archaeon]